MILGRVVAPGEPEWLEEDLNGALALQAEEDATCSGCGQPTYESMHPQSEGIYNAHYLVCHACAELDRLKRRLGDEQTEPGARLSVDK